MNLPRILILSAIGVGIGFAQPYRPLVVMGESMSPTLANHSVLWVVSPKEPVERGQVVVFRHNGETMVKRVAFIGGDTLLEYKFAGEWRIPSMDKEFKVVRRQRTPVRHVRIAPGELFVIGDNFSRSCDSRTYGPIPEDSVIGVFPTPDIEPSWKMFVGYRLQPTLATLRVSP